MNLQKMSNPWVLGAILGVFGIISAGILAWFYSVTATPIEESRTRRIGDSLATVLPAFDNDVAANKYSSGKVNFYGAVKDGALIGIAAEASTNTGYAGHIAGLVGISPAGEVLTLKGGRSAVIITEQGETPGLGTNVTNRQEVKTLAGIIKGEKSDPEVLPGNRVLDSFAGVNTLALPLATKKDGGEIEYITGATISSNAVTSIVDSVLAEFKANKTAILAALGGGEEAKQ